MTKCIFCQKDKPEDDGISLLCESCFLELNTLTELGRQATKEVEDSWTK